MKHLICASAFLLASLALSAAAEPLPPPGLKRDIEFAKPGGTSLTLDAFVPEGDGPFATCILVHGGGFTKGDKQTFIKPLFEPLAQAGFAWFTINYRLAPQHRWPACAEDVAAAIRWVKTHAAEYKVDVNRIALIGESAGGHLVSWAAVTGSGETRVAAAVAFYAPHDLVLQVKGRNALGEGLAGLTGLTTLDDDTWRILAEMSPINHITPGLPPVLQIHGNADDKVPLVQSINFEKRMKTAGNTCETITIADGGHGMGGWAKLNTDYQVRMINWLRRTLN